MTPDSEAPGGRERAQGGTHIPVLLSEVMEALTPADGETYIDATFGAGGYSRALLEAAECAVIAFDRDPQAIGAGKYLAEKFLPRLTLHCAPFSAMSAILAGQTTSGIDAVVFDLGVSSMQLDEPERGFSFLKDGPLDMRMFAHRDDDGTLPSSPERGPSAAEVVNTFEEEQLADLIYQFGEERRSRAIARAIVQRRQDALFARTKELADVVTSVFGGRGKTEKRHPATRTFQALRIYVNDELGELRRGLEAAEQLLKPGGRLVVVSFHSLEDRIVKQFIAERTGKRTGASRHMPELSIKLSPPSFQIFNPRPLTPSKGELNVNPRSRSARLRAAVRTGAPAQGPGATP